MASTYRTYNAPSDTGDFGILDLAPFPIDLDGLPPRGSLPAVLDGHVKLLQLAGLVDVGYCDEVLTALSAVAFKDYGAKAIKASADDDRPTLKIGPTAHWQFEEEENGLELYFSEAASTHAELRQRFSGAGIVDPLDLLVAILKYLWSGTVEIATEGDKQYFAGVVRSVTGGADPHTDNAQRTPELAIGKVVSQGSILLYLRMPPAGGGVKVFHKRPESPVPIDGLGWRGVAGLQFSGATPSAGDVVIFPTTYMHAVEPVIGEGERVTISSFFGALPDGRLVVWS